MPQKIDPTKTKTWDSLGRHFQRMKNVHLKDLFAEEPGRFEKFSLRFQDLLVDYAKNRITLETMKLLFSLAEEIGLPEAIEKMFTGDQINETEKRAVLHVALRNRSNSPIYVDGQDVMPRVNAVLEKMKSFSEKVISGDGAPSGRRSGCPSPGPSVLKISPNSSREPMKWTGISGRRPSRETYR